MPGHSSYESHAELRFAECQLHGVLVYVFGSGVLLTGDSGVGKTACAIELLRRGHSLVADDAVQIFQSGRSLFGRAPEITRSLVNTREAGIQNVTELFDHAVLRDDCRIDLCIEIQRTNVPMMTKRMDSVQLFQIRTDRAEITAAEVERIVKDLVH